MSVERKQAAREITAEFLTASRGRPSPRLFVRINDLASGLADDDLAAVMPSLPFGILLPKSNSGKDVTRLSAKLNVHEAQAGVEEARHKSLRSSPKPQSGRFLPELMQTLQHV